MMRFVHHRQASMGVPPPAVLAAFSARNEIERQLNNPGMAARRNNPARS
jgi:hypothetical protein